MSDKKKIHLASYQSHTAAAEKRLADEAGRTRAQTWLREDSIDAWLHRRLFSCLDPLIKAFPESRWLTVGDGRFGKDAHYLKSRGIDVLATDISDVLLKEGQACGFIDSYRAENAEALSFDDETFDFVLCKEAYHHFPRPMIALYEMIRVARRAVVLIEPSDNPSLLPVKALMLKTVKAIAVRLGLQRLFGSRDTSIIAYNPHLFEDDGNYAYHLSEREVEKVAVGLSLPAVAFAGMNTYYVKDCEFEPAEEQSAVFQLVKRKIKKRDKKCANGLNFAAPDVLVSIIFKEKPAQSAVHLLQKKGFNLNMLPRNPHLLQRENQ